MNRPPLSLLEWIGFAAVVLAGWVVAAVYHGLTSPREQWRREVRRDRERSKANRRP